MRALAAFFSLCVSSNVFAGPAPVSETSFHETWWDPAASSAISAADAAVRVAGADIVVLGESHYQPLIHEAQGAIIEALAQGDRDFVVGWEFLNTEDESFIWETWLTAEAADDPAAAFLEALFPEDEGALAYAPMVAAVRRAGLFLHPTNLSRDQKAPVVSDGIEGADPALIPEGFAMGGIDYFARFLDAMGTHPLPHPVENYFAAQCLTDDAMAHSLLAVGAPDAQRVLVVGSFHGDFRDGVVERFASRAPASQVLYVRIVDGTDMQENEVVEFISDESYGPRADLVVVVR